VSRVTVAIPTYSRVQWLGETIASALGQTFTDLVVEVHDDATPDDSVERVVSSFCDPRLKYIRYPENVGIVGNFTRSLLGASTEYVIQLGDDDVASPTLVERTVAALDRYPSAGMVHSRFSLIDAAGDVLVADEDWLGTPSPPLEPGPLFIERSMLHGSRVCTSTALIRRSAVPSDGFRQRDHPPFDFAFWLRMAKTWDIAWADEVLCAYRIHRRSFTSGLSDVTDHGYMQAERMMREVHRVKLEQADGRRDWERLADRGLREEMVYRVRERTLPDRRFGPTFRGLGRAARREPSLLREPTAWALLAGSLVGQRWVDRLKGRA
jgi:glycosyltransferase involved in cell wall biosynthesis